MRRGLIVLRARGVVLLLFLRGMVQRRYDVIVRGGTVYDGTGAPGRRADVGIRGDRIAAVGDLATARAATTVDATGLAVAPGFINMLSWSTESLLVDGRSQGEIRQGVTTQIFGEGSSMGPLNAGDEAARDRADGRHQVRHHLDHAGRVSRRTLERRGVSQNVASFIGATTIREHVIGLEDKKPTPAELDEMRALVRQEMEAGALGIGSSLIYAPAFYASTEELIELCKVAAQYHGKYISHIRSEGNRLLEAVDELIRIAAKAKMPAEIYHLKAAGQANWPKMDAVIAEDRGGAAEGLKITADMYTYTAGATGLDASMPPWVLDGGYDAAYKRLRDPEPRGEDRRRRSARRPTIGRTSTSRPARRTASCWSSSSPSALKPLTGKTLAEAAQMRGEDPVDTIMNLVLEDQLAGRDGLLHDVGGQHPQADRAAVGVVRLRRRVDGAGAAVHESSTHPRAYGNFARVLGKYVRDEKVLTLADAVPQAERPARHQPRARSTAASSSEGMFADVVVFDPATIADRADVREAAPVRRRRAHVFVNGVQVLRDGEHTGAKPGRALWGPGKKSVKTESC